MVVVVVVVAVALESQSHQELESFAVAQAQEVVQEQAVEAVLDIEAVVETDSLHTFADEPRTLWWK